MILSKVFTSFTFRFLVAYVAWLGVSVFLVLSLIYAFIAYGFFDEVQQSLEQEVQELAAAYQQGGPQAVDRLIRDHSSPERLIRFFYLVADADRQKIAGDLQQWPADRAYGKNWQDFRLESLTDFLKPVGTEFITRSHRLDSGEYVVVARHYGDVINSTKLVAGALTRSMIATIVLGTLGGAVVSALTLRRVELVNNSLRRIMQGDFSERIDVLDKAGDLRRLCETLNRMLDRIEVLMNGVRQVSDNIAHDLRTPLTRLRGRLSDLQADLDSASGERVQEMLDEADELLGTFNALLRIAQVESGNRRSGFSAVDLSLLLADVAELYEPLAADKGLSLDVKIAPIGSYFGDRNLLFQAFANLFDNAIKYTPEGGQVAVRALRGAEGVDIVIADSGIGIPPEDYERVFHRFYRVEGSRSRHPGNGLGLSLVKAVVNLHGGKIELADNRPGLNVLVHLPAEQDG